MIRMEVYSSHGTLTIDTAGKVLPEHSTYDDDELRDIVSVDVQEWLQYYKKPFPCSFDILDLGLFLKGGKYEPPEVGWREEVKKFRGENV